MAQRSPASALPHRDREGSKGSSHLLFLLGWSWEASGCCQHSPGAAPHRSCQHRHPVTAAWKGESSGRGGISLLCPPRQPTTNPRAAPYPACAAPGAALGPYPGLRLYPHDGSWLPQNQPSITAAQSIPASTWASTCPLPTTTCSLSPAPWAIPQTWTDPS